MRPGWYAPAVRRAFVIPLLLWGCAHSSIQPAVFPEREIEPGILVREVRLDDAHRLRIYQPKSPAKGRLPCVFVAPAGAHLFDGNHFDEDDGSEELPYVRAGYIAVEYDVSGALPDGRWSRAQVRGATSAFHDSRLGVEDGRRAIAYAKANLPIDRKRIVVAGHSSAATLALMVAEDSPDVAACLAYAPVVNVLAHFTIRTQTMLERDAPEVLDDWARLSPLARKSRLRCPTLVFHAADDSIVPREPLASFARSVPNTQWIEVPSGDHYDSMIQEGIPDRLAFLKAHGFAPR